MATRQIADEEGNTLPPLDPTGGVAQIIHLLEYARRRGFRIGPTVQVGEVIVQVADLRQAREFAEEGKQPEASIWKEHGHDEE